MLYVENGVLLQHTHSTQSCAIMHYDEHGKAAASAVHYSDTVRILIQEASPTTS